jgi:plastocyanin
MRSHGGWIASCVALLAAGAGAARAQPGTTVAGRLAILEKGGKRTTDVGQAVIWLEASRAAAPAGRVEIATEKKQFLPHVLVVPAGSAVSFPNHDPFNHNVFSLSEAGPFDLGLYNRGETRTARFSRPGIIRIYCNVHASMNAFVVVRDNPFYTQPGADGSFAIADVPPGAYTLQVWHERGGEASRKIEVGPAGLQGLELTLDARGFKSRPHLNKFGKPYDDEGRGY